jgi:hypothetical protein
VGSGPTPPPGSLKKACLQATMSLATLDCIFYTLSCILSLTFLLN